MAPIIESKSRSESSGSSGPNIDVQTLRQRARQDIEQGAVTSDYDADPEVVIRLLNEALAVEEDMEDHKPSAELLALDGMDEHTAYILASRGVVSRDDLAELAVDEIVDIEGMDAEHAAKLIMAARQHWFE